MSFEVLGRASIFGKRDSPEVTTVKGYGIKADVIEFGHDVSNSIDEAIVHYVDKFENAIYDLRRDFFEADVDFEADAGYESNISVLFMLEVQRRPHLWKLIPGLFTRMFCETYDLVTKHRVVEDFTKRFDFVNDESLRTLNDPNRNLMGHVLVSSAMLKVMEVAQMPFDHEHLKVDWRIDDDRVTLEWTDYSNLGNFYQERVEVKVAFALADDRSFEKLRMSYRTVPSIVSDGEPSFVFYDDILPHPASYLVLGFDTELREDGSLSATASLFRRVYSDDDGVWIEEKRRSLDDGEGIDNERERIDNERKRIEDLFRHIMSTTAPLMTMRAMRDDRLSSLLDRRLT